jgi:AAA domain
MGRDYAAEVLHRHGTRSIWEQAEHKANGNYSAALVKDHKQQFTLYRDLAVTSTKEWLVKNLLGHAEASAFYGAPGSGKSALVEDMGLHIAAGLPWHGRDVKQGAVCYVALERRMLVERRAMAFRKRHNIPDLPFAIIGGVFDFRDSRAAATIGEIVRRVEDEIEQKVISLNIDTISRALAGGDENSSKDMGAIVNTTARLQETTGASIAWVHHVPVDGGERLRGHGALLGALDTTINVEKLASGLRTATVIKANDSEEGEKITFTLESVSIGPETTAPVVVPAEDQQRATTSEPRLTKNLQTMYSLLHAAGQTGLLAEEWNARARAEGLGVKRRADLVDYRLALKAKNLVREYADRWHVAT